MTVEHEVGLDGVEWLVAVLRRFEVVEQFVQPSHLFGGRDLGRGAGRHPLESERDVEQFVDVGSLERGDLHSATGDGGHEADTFEFHQCGPDRTTADGEPGGQGRLGERLARCELAADDEVTDLGAHHFPKFAVCVTEARRVLNPSDHGRTLHRLRMTVNGQRLTGHGRICLAANGNVGA